MFIMYTIHTQKLLQLDVKLKSKVSEFFGGKAVVRKC